MMHHSNTLRCVFGMFYLHHAFCATVVVAVVFLFGADGHYSGQFDNDNSSLLTGPNVCTRNETVRSFTQKRVFYPCVRWQWVKCRNGRMRSFRNWKRRGRWRRRWCKSYIHKTCSRMALRCEPVQVVHKFCCPGYEETAAHTCRRSSPCAVNNGGCDQICHHTDNGGHVCSCFHGYQKDSETGKCKDVNECSAGNGGCGQICVNTPGSYYCVCRSGYTETGNNCSDVNECSFGNGGCEHLCTNTPGSYHCACQLGYQLREKYNCADVDECLVKNGGCSHICENLDGEYMCECPLGFQLKADNKTCQVMPRSLPEDVSPLQNSGLESDENHHINGNVSSLFALRHKEADSFFLWPLLFFVGTFILAVVYFLTIFIRKRKIQSQQVYSVPIGPRDDHIYSVPVLFDKVKKTHIESEKNVNLAFENPGYDYCHHYEDVVVSAYDYPDPFPTKD